MTRAVLRTLSLCNGLRAVGKVAVLLLVAISFLESQTAAAQTGPPRASSEKHEPGSLDRPTWGPNRPGSSSDARAAASKRPEGGLPPSDEPQEPVSPVPAPKPSSSSTRLEMDLESLAPVSSGNNSTYLDDAGEYLGDEASYTHGYRTDRHDPSLGCCRDSALDWYGYEAPWCGSTYASPYSSGSWLLRDRLWVQGEYLLWWMQGSHVPPLVTTSTPAALGVLGKPDTTVLFGDTGLNTGARSGGRITLGYWLDAGQHLGIEADYLGIGRETTRFHSASDGDPLLARPFFNIVTGEEDSHIFAFAPVLRGSVQVLATSEFQSAEVLLRRTVFRLHDSRVDGFDQEDYRVMLLAGWRFSRLDDRLQIAESLEAAGPTTLDLYDLFDTRNRFHGGELGVVAQFCRRKWSLDLLMKLALGNSRSDVLIDGSTTTAVGGGPPVTATGGLLALTTNVGRYTRNDFAMIPELGITLGYDITQHWRATFGYTFVYWSRVARPGDQIDRDVNRSYLPNEGPTAGAPRPEFSFITTDFWAQGMDFGLEYRF